MPSSFPTLCGSIASRPSTLGVAMHTAAYRATGVPFTYVAFQTDNTRDAVLATRSLGIRGLGVSMPHKIEIMQYLDAIDETAARIGSVNTVVNDDGRLTGYNTDWIGAVRALQEQVSLAGTRSVVVGAGGAARAIIYGLLAEGSQVTVYNRTRSRGLEIAAEFGARYGGDLPGLGSVDDYDILINATPVGLDPPDQSIVPATALKPDRVVLDVVYLPPESRLIQEAQAADCRAISANRMRIHQALFQFELYTGRQAPIEAMEQALLDALGRPKS